MKLRNVRERQARRYVRRMPQSPAYLVTAGVVQQYFARHNRRARRGWMRDEVNDRG